MPILITGASDVLRRQHRKERDGFRALTNATFIFPSVFMNPVGGWQSGEKKGAGGVE